MIVMIHPEMATPGFEPKLILHGLLGKTKNGDPYSTSKVTHRGCIYKSMSLDNPSPIN